MTAWEDLSLQDWVAHWERGGKRKCERASRLQRLSLSRTREHTHLSRATLRERLIS